MTQINNSDYYSLSKILTYNSVVNMVCGGRNIGKTFAVKKRMLERYVKYGEQGFYLRRTKTELDEIDKESFFTDDLFEQVFTNFEMLKNEQKLRFTEIVFTCDNEGYEEKENSLKITSSKITLNDTVVCYLKSLSTWLKLKGSEYDKVTTILFDEVLIPTENTYSRYIPNEISTLVQLIISILRRRKNLKVFLMSNSIDENNPYFDFLKIDDTEGKEFIVPKFTEEEMGEFKKINPNMLIWVVEFPPNIGYSDDSPLVPLLRRLGDYDSTVNNQFKATQRKNIGRLGGEKLRLYTLYCGGAYIGVFRVNGITYFKKSYDKDDMILTLNKGDVDTFGYILLERNDGISKFLRNGYRSNNLHYHDVGTKYLFLNSFNKIL